MKSSKIKKTYYIIPDWVKQTFAYLIFLLIGFATYYIFFLDKSFQELCSLQLHEYGFLLGFSFIIAGIGMILRGLIIINRVRRGINYPLLIIVNIGFF